MKKPNSAKKKPPSIDEIREEIDKIDDEIISCLEKRFSYVLKIERKKLTDKKREDFILAKIKCPYIKKVYKAIFANAKKARVSQRGFFSFLSSCKKWVKFPIASEKKGPTKL